MNKYALACASTVVLGAVAASGYIAANDHAPIKPSSKPQATATAHLTPAPHVLGERVTWNTKAPTHQTLDADGDLVLRVSGHYYQLSYNAHTKRWTVGDEDRRYTECKTEDSNGCVWNAVDHGNHRGMNWFATPNGRVFYLVP